MSLYKTLELKPSASVRDIKKAYHRLALIYHPDKGNEYSNEKFHEINYAYQILSNQKTRQEYHRMNNLDQNKFQVFLNKIFSNNLKIDELSSLGITLSKEDFSYLDSNFSNLINRFNFKELFNFFTKGKVERKSENESNLCSDSEINIWNSDQAEYFYSLPLEYQKINKDNINLNINISFEDIISKKQRKLKIARRINSKNKNTTFIFDLNHPFIVFNGAGDITDDNDTSNLIIKLNLPNNFTWENNFIVYNQPVTLYQMIYGIDLSLDLGFKKIELSNWVPSRDGYSLEIENVLINNNYLMIRFYLNYKHTENKEIVLQKYFN